MRIDLNRAAAGQIANELASASKRVESSKLHKASAAEDKATLSSDSVSISTLANKAMEHPEIRQDKVDAIRQRIESGSYKIDHGKIADVILEEHKK